MKLVEGDRVFIGHQSVRDRLWRWSESNDTPHQVWRQMPGEHPPEKMEPGRDYKAIDVTAETITIEGDGYRAKARHNSESPGGMTVGQVVEITEGD